MYMSNSHTDESKEFAMNSIILFLFGYTEEELGPVSENKEEKESENDVYYTNN